MNDSVPTSPQSVSTPTATSLTEKLVSASVLALMLAGVAFGAVLSAKALHRQVLGNTAMTSSLLIQKSPNHATVIHPV
jgi:hypothetical protein